MSTSISYAARRRQPLTPAEQAAIAAAVDLADVEEHIIAYCTTGEGYNWESFDIAPPDPAHPEIVFAGSTNLPDNTEEAMEAGLRHWCALLTVIRRALPGATWQVDVMESAVKWDAARDAYDPFV